MRPLSARRLLKFRQQLGFKALGIDRHFTGGNLLFCGPVVAKLADAEALFGAHGRPENAAGHGAGKIQITKAGDGIERRTGLVIGEVFKAGFAFGRWIQQASRRVAGEILDEPGDRSPRPLANGTGAFRIGRTELLQPLLETGCIQLMDSENPHATWRATGLADQPIPAAAGCVGQRSIENLYQFGVTQGKHGFFSAKKRVNRAHVAVVYAIMNVAMTKS